VPTGRADIGLKPSEESLAFLRRLRKDFEKVQHLLELVVNREKLKHKQVCLSVSVCLSICLSVRLSVCCCHLAEV